MRSKPTFRALLAAVFSALSLAANAQQIQGPLTVGTPNTLSLAGNVLSTNSLTVDCSSGSQTTYCPAGTVAVSARGATLYVGAFTYTLQSTAIYGGSWSVCFQNSGASGNATINSTSAQTFIGAGNGTSITLGPSQWACTVVDPSGNWSTPNNIITNALLPTLIPVSIGWVAGQNPNNAILFTNLSGGSYTVQAIVGRVEVAEGAVATITVNSAASATACSSGTAISSSFNANGTAATNQTITSGTPTIANGTSICLQTTGAAWSSGSAIGGITAFLKPN